MARREEGWTLHRDPRTGVYTVRFRVAGRRTHRSTRTRDRGEALARAAQIYEEAVNPTAVAPAGPAALAGTKTQTLVAAWLAAMESEKRAPTVDTWTLYGRTHWVPFFRDAGELASERRLAAYVTSRLKCASSTTVAKECSALQTLLRWCARADVGYLAAAPKVPRPPKGAGRRVLEKVRVDLTPEVAEAIIEALPEHVRRKERGGEKRPCRALFRVLWETGLRIGTLRRLEAPRDYRRGAAELSIPASADKSGYERTVDLTARARAALDAVCPDAGPIFGEAINLRTQLLAAAKAAGVPGHLAPHVSPHDFRHARTTDLVSRPGVSLADVSYLVGHKQATTTNGYVHARRSGARAAIALLDSGHRPGHEAAEADATAEASKTKAPEKPGPSRLGHPGLEPGANGLRVQSEVPLRAVLRAIPGHARASTGHEKQLSGHGVPAIEAVADALVEALEARREGSPHAWDRVLDAAELVAEIIESVDVDAAERQSG